MKRYKLRLVVAGIAVALLVLLSWTQLWFTVTLDDGQSLDVAGQAAAPGLSALALASLALCAALTIAGPVLRIILGAVETAMGLLAVAAAAEALSDPVAVSARVVTDATGLSGKAAIADLVVANTATPWPWLAVVAGVLGVVVGATIMLTARRWPVTARRYETAPDADDGGAIGAWDALSRGSDPTAPR